MYKNNFIAQLEPSPNGVESVLHVVLIISEVLMISGKETSFDF